MPKFYLVLVPECFKRFRQKLFAVRTSPRLSSDERDRFRDIFGESEILLFLFFVKEAGIVDVLIEKWDGVGD